jgi:hypothetical protein
MTDDELLTPRQVTGNDALRAELLARTAGQLHAGRRLRLAGRVAVCAACFVAGLAVAWFRPAPEPRTVYVAVHEPAPPAVTPDSQPPTPRTLTAADLELAAEQVTEKTEAARRFREAGDRYLRDYADYRAALRCYRNFLDEADPADLRVVPEDTWLLTSLKRAREQESAQ